jgi:thioredoxin reductase
MTSPAVLGAAGLVVVGCGPTGVAGLVQAAIEGIPAIGIEAGPAPLASVAGYMDGLVLKSPAFHYEIGGLPLDCRAIKEATREDLLHYYARVIACHGLDIRCSTRCVGLEPRRGHVEIRVETGGRQGIYRAERVLMTSWHERRPLALDRSAADHDISLCSAIENPIQLAGKKVVILGGGMSAYEYATRLLLTGQRIVLLARGEPRSMYESPRFRRLLSATGSAAWHQVSDVGVGRSRVEFTRDGVRCAVPCDVLVAAIGQRLREDVLRMLTGAGVLAEREARRLRQAKSYEKVRREFPQEDGESHLKRAVAELPDLRQQLFEGRRGIQLAGGALHVGAANAGVMYSIFTATLAVRAMAGHALPAGAAAPLPAYLAAVNIPERMSPAVAFDHISPLRPLRATGRSRNSVTRGGEEAAGTAGEEGGRRLSLRRPRLLQEEPEIERVLRAADGTRSVAELARHFGMRSAAERATFWRLLRYLWWNDALTWLPPGARS